MAEHDPKVLAEAEERVAQLVKELEKVQSVSTQLNGAKDGLHDATSKLKTVAEGVSATASALQDVAGQLRRLEPQAIMDRLEDASLDRRRLSVLVRLTLGIAALSLVAAVASLVLSFGN